MGDDVTRSLGPRAPLPDARLRLIVFGAGGVASHVLPRRGEIVLGRGSEADVTVEHFSVSRRHAALRIGETIDIVDLGSHNGTRIGGKALTPHEPAPLDIATIVELGGTMVVVQIDGPDAVTGTRTGAATRDRRKEQPELSEAMLDLHRMVDHVADSNLSVVIRGETGAGKEVFAEEIHARSARAGGPLVKLNCAALPEQLLEGELFGYERGAFTGAAAAKPGLVEAAEGGTLFLDEIGELPLATQAKLLRVVESREVLRLGALRARPVDLRLVSATHRDLEEMVAVGTFRQDLYYRINGVSLWIPPLRERVSEIPALAKAFAERFCKESKRPIVPITDDAIQALVAHPWPGNVRELRNVIERAIVFCRSVAIGPEHLGLGAGRPSGRPGSSSPGVDVVSSSPGAKAAATVFGSGTLADAVDAVERERILQALAQCDGNQTLAAERLGISRRTLLRRLDDLGLPRPRKG